MRRNTKIKNSSFIVLLFTIILSSCSKDLALNPSDTFGENNAFLTIDDIQSGTNGAYGELGAYLNDMYVNAVISDEARLGIDNAGQGALTYRLQYSSDGVTGGDVVAAWGAYYSVIDQVNRVLQKVPVVSAAPGQEPRRNILKAQLLAIRAYSYFELLEAYCKRYSASDNWGVPVVLEPDILRQPARNTVAEVTSRIEEDFDSAYALLPVVTSSSFYDTVFNRINIDAIRARYSLYKGDWDNAIKYSTNVISSNVKPLADSADFLGIWTDENSDETLLRVRYANSTSVGGMWTTTNGLIYIAPSDKLVGSYDTSDVRLNAYIGTDESKGAHYVNKFYTSSRGGRMVDAKLARISEMYLIRAEANAKKSSPDISAAAADLNLLRSKRISGYHEGAFSSTATVLNAIYDERFKELCFEGFRFFDLKRNSLELDRNASDANSTWQTLPVSNYRWVLPIPQDEMLANPNMVQNDGYNNTNSN
ncbi:MAG TPA: RagB/SusD family nutrient uptake outer membrane protein [Arachidicoccus sp.]